MTIKKPLPLSATFYCELSATHVFPNFLCKQDLTFDKIKHSFRVKRIIENLLVLI